LEGTKYSPLWGKPKSGHHTKPKKHKTTKIESKEAKNHKITYQQLQIPISTLLLNQTERRKVEKNKLVKLAPGLFRIA
jgi:hypothetical protein